MTRTAVITGITGQDGACLSTEIPRAAGDATLLRQVTGWKPQRPMIGLLYELLEWWRAQG